MPSVPIPQVNYTSWDRHCVFFVCGAWEKDRGGVCVCVCVRRNKTGRRYKVILHVIFALARL